MVGGIRLVIKKNVITVELHAFADASEKAYGVIIYTRTLDELGNIDIKFLNAQTRIASLRFTSLQRLELLSAHAASKLMSFSVEALQGKINRIHLWLDSVIALCWISKSSSNWKPFVSNRVQEIHNSYDKSLWHYIKGSENPVDLVTQGMGIEEWLLLPESAWPNSEEKQEHIECAKEVKSSTAVLVTQTISELNLK